MLFGLIFQFDFKMLYVHVGPMYFFYRTNYLVIAHQSSVLINLTGVIINSVSRNHVWSVLYFKEEPIGIKSCCTHFYVEYIVYEI